MKWNIKFVTEVQNIVTKCDWKLVCLCGATYVILPSGSRRNSFTWQTFYHFCNTVIMSRMRSGLKPTVPSRNSPTKFPPVRTGWGTKSPPVLPCHRDPDWSTDMVRGVQLRTVAKTPLAGNNSPRTSTSSDQVKTPPLPKQEEKKVSKLQQNEKEKEIEVSHK